MDKKIHFIQKKIEIILKKKYSKNYIKLNILPIIDYINSSNENKFIIGGSQGVGKSSLILILKKTLEKFYEKKVLSLSLDDFYLSQKERKILSQKEHELLLTRGVPGTHNIKNLIKTVKKFEKKLYPISLPIFDKLIDDTTKKKNVIKNQCNILILEGWCCGSNYINKEYLYKNINNLEKKFDKNFKWRNYYNNKLKNEYKKLFDMFDKKIFIKAPSFKYVLDWRLKQEINNSSYSRFSKKMDVQEIKEFLQYYEKITKWMLKESKNNSDFLIFVNKNQKIYKTIIY
ncbi:MAG: uridine kinase [Alphaproteobacteria bacterium]